MRHESRVLPIRASVGAATDANGVRVSSLRDLVLQVSGTFTATFNAMGQAVEGGPWLQVGADITTPGWVTIPHILFAIRLDTEAFTSLDPGARVILQGLDHRGE
jgi:hypothetical protein